MKRSVVIILEEHELFMGALMGLDREMRALKRGARDRYAAKSPWEDHIEGALAELALARYLGVYWNGGAVGDSDVAGGYEVRRTPHENGHLTIFQSNPNDAPYVLVTGRAGRYTLQGWIMGSEGKRPNYLQTGYGQVTFSQPTYWIPQSALSPMESLPTRLQEVDDPF